ncbi:MAG: glutamate-cysteine ligase family protein [Elusimicrobiota bacterium]
MSSVYQLLKSHPNPGRRKIGIEVERLLIDRRPLRYEPDVRVLLETLVARHHWRPTYESAGKILAVEKDGHAVTIEPGGQFEVSSGPRETIAVLKIIKEEIDEDIAAAMSGRSAGFLCVGLNPWDRAEDIPLLPSPRYRLMDAHFQRLGGRGREMMRLSLGLQVNLDIDGEKLAVEMLRSAFYAAPVLSSWFANSPCLRGARTPHLSERHFVWRETDAARSGFPPCVFAEGFNLKSYGAYVGRTPLMYAFDAAGEVWDPQGRCLDDLDPEMREINTLPAVKQIFTEARLKPCCVEARFFDQLDDDLRYAAVALTVGLLYDEENRRWLNKKYAGAKAPALAALMKKGAESGLKNAEIYAAGKEFFAAAEKGLLRRGLREEAFLAPAEELLRVRRTPAEDFRVEL